MAILNRPIPKPMPAAPARVQPTMTRPQAPVNNVPSGPNSFVPTPIVHPVAAPPQAAPSMGSMTTAAPSAGVNSGELGAPWAQTFGNAKAI